MKILVGYDGSNVAKDAVDLAIKHANAFDASMVFVITSMVGGREVPIKDFEKAERNLEYIDAQVKEHNIPCETKLLVRGFGAGEDIVLFAKENGIDEIVIGVKRRSKVGKFVFGSTAQYVILEAPCPVVTIK